jgi:peptidoglycan/xylan/chitin deacetylase (PgdA/CDA1 family)
MKTCFLSIDVEKREDDGSFEGIEKLDNILNVFKKHKVNATLFTTGEVLAKYPDLVKKWSEDFEIGCHGYYHNTLDKLNLGAREQQIGDFCRLYQNVFKTRPRGFRAPRNIIDNEQFPILEKYGFLYDASVFPRYPLRINRYEGYRGKAPIFPYWPNDEDYRKRGPSTSLEASNKLLEIPESPASFSVPLVGTWLRKLGVFFFKILFRLKKPQFISFSMHSWDGIKFEGKSSKNSGEIYLKQLDEMLEFLKKIGYEFKNGEQIASDATSL